MIYIKILLFLIEFIHIYSFSLQQSIPNLKHLIFSQFEKLNKQRTMSYSMLSENTPSWDVLTQEIMSTKLGTILKDEELLRERGRGSPHTDSKIRIFDEPDNTIPRLTFFRDSAAWCPYCQKVWMFLEEKKIPYIIEKINMRSYGEKPAAFLRIVPNGLLPAIMLDGKIQTESLDIMLNLNEIFSGEKYPSLWPSLNSPEYQRATNLMRLERDLFSRWCNLVFRPSMGDGPLKRFEEGLDKVDSELKVTSSPWFLEDLSIVDLTYLSHIERMLASVAFWSGVKIRGSGRWKAIERWFDAFEERPSYLATKSDYYTHVMDIPPQYGPGYSIAGAESFARIISGKDNHWKLPLPEFQPTDLEPISSKINPGDENSRHEAAYKLIKNHDSIVKFALRGAGEPGKKRFQAPLADPFAIPNLSYYNEMNEILKFVS